MITLHDGDNRENLRKGAFSSDALEDLIVGTAAEHLVCYSLLMSGYRTFLADQNCPYDVAVDIGKLVRIQVKATRRQRSIPQRSTHIPAYMWHVRRAGKNHSRNYGPNEFDILALVALDIEKIAYMPPSEQKKTIHIRPPGANGGKQFSDYPFEKALREIDQ